MILCRLCTQKYMVQGHSILIVCMRCVGPDFTHGVPQTLFIELFTNGQQQSLNQPYKTAQHQGLGDQDTHCIDRLWFQRYNLQLFFFGRSHAHLFLCLVDELADDSSIVVEVMHQEDLI